MSNIKTYECKKCNESKPIEKMCKRKNTKGIVVVRPQCQICKYKASSKYKNKERMKKYYENNKEKINKRSKEYYENNRERILEKSKKKYTKNKVKQKEYFL